MVMMAMMATMATMATMVMMETAAAGGGEGGGSGDGDGDGCGGAFGRLPLVNDATIVTMTLMTRPTLLTRPTSSTCCCASARGRLPKTNSIRRHLDDNEVG
jgi:hypothetical protein